MADLIVSTQDGELVVDSRLIAEKLGIEHRSLIKSIEKYATQIQAFGQLRFEIQTVTNSVGARNTVKFAYLNEAQATLLMSLSRNTQQVVDCKVDLVAAFEKAKQIIKTVIPAQNDRLRELELVNENLKIQLQWADKQDNRIALHGLPVALLLEGKSDAVVEVDRPIIEVIDQSSKARFKGQTTKQLAEYCNQKCGTKFKSGAEVAKQLKAAGREDLLATTPRAILQDYIPLENLHEAIDVLVQGDRQFLLGE